ARNGKPVRLTSSLAVPRPQGWEGVRVWEGAVAWERDRLAMGHARGKCATGGTLPGTEAGVELACRPAPAVRGAGNGPGGRSPRHTGEGSWAVRCWSS